MLTPAQITSLRRAFVDVARGYSIGHLDRPIYIRHLTHKEHLGYEDLEWAQKEYAISKGALTEEQRIDILKNEGLWSDDRDAAIARQKDTVVRFEEGLKTLVVPSMIRNHQGQIEIERKKLDEMTHEKAHLIGPTAETYAQRVVNDHHMMVNLFADDQFRVPLFAPETFEDLADSEVRTIHEVYVEAIKPCEEANLRRLAVQDFFTSYYYLCQDNLYSFYGKPICDLTYYQVRLGNLGRYFKSLMENMDMGKLEPGQRNDPDVIERGNISQRNMTTMSQEGKVPTGLTSSDIKEMGLQNTFSKVPPPGLSGVELVQWLRKNNKGR